jgi:glutaryl-CoA dehydrogenase
MNAKFDWQDPLRLDEHLRDVARAVQAAARQYAENKLLPRVRDAFREEKPEQKLSRVFGDQGLLGVSLVGYGCPGGNHVM